VAEDKLFMGADCALNVVPSDEKRLEHIRAQENILNGNRPSVGFNINSYIDAFVRNGGPGIGKDNFLRIMASVIDRTIDTLGVDAVLVITQPMDLAIAHELLDKIRHRQRIRLISNKTYSHGDIAKVLSRLEIFTGMRTHSLILSTAVGTPVAGIIAYPKNRGYLRSIEMGDQMIEFSDFSEANLWKLIEQTWKRRRALKERLIPIIEREKQKARHSADLLQPFLEKRTAS
jgi:polysaccharide pyruvyl transferase WcaK-like protein